MSATHFSSQRSLVRAFWGLLLGVLFSFSAFAQEPEKTFAAAKAAYQEGRYEEAAKLYESMVSSGVDDVSVYYNLGNAYAAQGLLGRAILWYQRALLQDPGSEDIRANLSLARRNAAERAEPPRVGPLPRGPEDRWTGVYTPRELTSFALYGYSAFLAALLLALLSRARKRRTLMMIFGAGALLGASVAVVFGVASWERAGEIEEENRAVVLGKNTSIKRGPIESAETLFALPEGEIIAIEEVRDGWGLVRLSGRPEGWVSLKEAALIKNN